MPSNHISEWFGHRVYPQVSSAEEALDDQKNEKCPFLSSVTTESRDCVKSKNSRGTCTISSSSNGQRQDWIVCPYRTVNSPVFDQAAEILFTRGSGSSLLVTPAPALERSANKARFYDALDKDGKAIIYFQDKLGGEISVSRTDRSPEFSFDVTLAELSSGSAGIILTRFGILEIQTMDFHGSYRHAVQNLQDALRLHGSAFPEIVQENPDWTGERMEGPNIANVFKRTFYQILMKFQVATHPECAGVVFAIPQAVWDSWQRYLGQPALVDLGRGNFELLQDPKERDAKSWILVFDILSDGSSTPNRIQVKAQIKTNADTLSNHAFKQVPELALQHGTSPIALLSNIQGRIATWIPELSLDPSQITMAHQTEPPAH